MRGRTVQFGLLTAVAILLAAAACVPRTPGVPDPPAIQPPLADTSWVLEQYGEPENLSPVLPNTELTVSFDGATEVTGLAGCNSYGGTYTSAVDGTLEFGMLHQTEMYCELPGVMEQEQAFMGALHLADRYQYVDGYLHISGGGKLLVFSRS